MTETILARIFERQLTLDRKIQKDVEQGRSLWEDMARSLAVIAANTATEGPRGGRVAIAERSAPSGGIGVAEKGDQRATFKPRSPKPIEVAPRQKKQTAASVGSVERKERDGSRSGASRKVPDRRHDTVGKLSTKQIPQVVGENQPRGGTEQTKAQEQMAVARQKSLAQLQGKSFAESVIPYFSRLGKSLEGRESLDEAAGIAAGGPIFTALKEVSDVLGDDLIFQKKDRKKDPRRDKNGRFLRSSQTAQEKEQLDLAARSLSLATIEAREEDRRHKELIRAVRSVSGNGGSSLLDRLSRRGSRGRAGRDGRQVDLDLGKPDRRVARKEKGRLARAKEGLGNLLRGSGQKAAKAATVATGVSAGLIATSADASAQRAEGAASALKLGQEAPAAVKAVGAHPPAAASAGAEKGTASIVGKTSAVLGKGAAGMTRMIPVIGQVVSAGLAVADGVEGWTDTQMHQDAFGLKDGQEATTAQKASAAAANILDMGGLLTGAANLVGFDVDTADLASGIYGVGESVGNLATNAWNSITGFFSGTSDTSESEGSKKTGEHAGTVASHLAEVLTGSSDGETVSLSPDGQTAGLFDVLSASLEELSDTIAEEIQSRKEEDGFFPEVTGAFSGIAQVIGNKLSSITGGGGGRHSGGGGPAKSTYVYDPNAKIGDAIATFESGTEGVKKIGHDGTGGTSYGKWQLSSTTAKGGEGSMQAYLRWMRKQGGEKKAIAERIAAAGPMNTGGRQGAAVEQYQKEVAANASLMEESQRQFLIESHYAPAMNRLSSDGLRKRIEGSKALQEAMFSTAVQHGAGSGKIGDAGAASIWNKVYREGMTDEELIRAVYAERGTRFSSSTGNVAAGVRNRFNKEVGLITSMRTTEQTGKNIAANLDMSKPVDAIQAAVSASLMDNTQKAIDRGVGYHMGGKDSREGEIDCSGWVAEVNRSLMDNVNAAIGEQVYSNDARKVLERGANGGAAGLIHSVSQATGELLGNADLSPDKIRAGMMIGLDTGRHSWDGGRFKGIDHIAQTYVDPQTGKMMVTESTSRTANGGRGVQSIPYEEFYAKWSNRAKLYGTDVTKLADASKVPQTALAQAPAGSLAQPASMAQGAVVAAAQMPVERAPDSVGQIAPPQNTGNNILETAGIEKLLQAILETMKKQGGQGSSGGDSPPHISMEFDDPAAQQLAQS